MLALLNGAIPGSVDMAAVSAEAHEENISRALDGFLVWPLSIASTHSAVCVMQRKLEVQKFVETQQVMTTSGPALKQCLYVWVKVHRVLWAHCTVMLIYTV